MGVLVNQGLVQLWMQALNTTPPATSTPRAANLITSPFVESPSLTYGSLSWAGAGHQVLMQPLWTVALQPGANYVSAVASYTWTLPPSDGGLVFYGVGLYDPNSLLLFEADVFPAPYVVPAGGSTLAWTWNLNFGNCADIP